MFISYDITEAEPVPLLKARWGREWSNYIETAVDGFKPALKEVEGLLKAVCYRERLSPQVGFALHIGHKSAGVEIFFRIDKIPRFLSLNLDPGKWLPLRFYLESKKELEYDEGWQNYTAHMANTAARFLLADLSRDGLPAEIKRSIGLIAQFSKTLYQSSIVLEWREVKN